MFNSAKDKRLKLVMKMEERRLEAEHKHDADDVHDDELGRPADADAISHPSESWFGQAHECRHKYAHKHHHKYAYKHQ